MRARNIKPGFFLNEQLGECSIPARLAFIGLWAVADREGRLVYRPKRLRAEIFPYDVNLDMAALIGELEANELVVIYEVARQQYLWIPNFAKHQKVHQNEQESEIPAYAPQAAQDRQVNTKNSQGEPKVNQGNPKIAPTCNQGDTKVEPKIPCISESLNLESLNPPTPQRGELAIQPEGNPLIPKRKSRAATGNSLPELRAQMEAYTQNPELLDALEEWRVMREGKRARLTGRALKLTFDKLDMLAGSDESLKIAIVNQSIMRSWTGVFPLQADFAPGVQRQQPRSFAQQEQDRFEREMLEAAERDRQRELLESGEPLQARVIDYGRVQGLE